MRRAVVYCERTSSRDSRQARPRFSRGAYSASAEGPDHEIVPVHHGVHGEVPPVGGGPRPVSGAGPVPAAEARVGGHAGVRGHFELGVDVHADRAADRRRVAYRVAPYLDSELWWELSELRKQHIAGALLHHITSRCYEDNSMSMAGQSRAEQGRAGQSRALH